LVAQASSLRWQVGDLPHMGLAVPVIIGNRAPSLAIIEKFMPQFLAKRFNGRLIVVEGIDGSGKSTQLSLLSQWLRLRGYAVAFSEWNSSPLVRETTRRGKKKEMFTPTTFSLIHATDFADRLERYILPLLKAGAVVCADRYAYTAFARDVVRGVDPSWVRNLYRFAIKPDLAFYFKVPLEVALGRILGGRNALKYYEAGMDLELSRNIEESFRIFQGRILVQYEAMIEEMGFHVIDATKSIEAQQREMRRIVVRELGRTRPPEVLGMEGMIARAQA
jgi:dTMP kinase